MRLTSIQKSPTGYILRARPANPMVVAYVILQALMGLIMLNLCLWLKPADGGMYLLLAGIFVGMPMAICLPLILWTLGERYELDEKGVHLRYTFRRERLLRWDEVRDWGVTQVWYSKQKDLTHMLYFSPAELPVIGMAYKKLDGRKDMCALGIHVTDYNEMVDIGLWDFCRSRLAAPPYIPADIRSI